MNDPVKQLVVDYISAHLDIAKDILTDEFDLADYIERNFDRETGVVLREDYIFFWGDFIKHFGIYDAVYDFEAFAAEMNYAGLKKRLMGVLFYLGLAGHRTTITKATINSLADSAREKRVSLAIVREITSTPRGPRDLRG